MKEKKYPIVNLGTISLLTVFIILAMLTFATLTYMTARKDAKYNEQSMKSAVEYQTAVNTAYGEIAKTDQALYADYQNGTLSTVSGTGYQIIVPISENSELQVLLTAKTPEQNNGFLYDITEFKKVSTKSFEQDNTLHLFQ